MDETYSITVAYDGAPFAGFARQPGQLTVQGELERALSLVFREDIETVCAGRTDAGVHALAQEVSFNIAGALMEGRSAHSFLRSMNALTHDSISVRGLHRRPAGFSARFDAKEREYKYFICTQDAPPIFTKRFSWHISQPLDVSAMRESSKYLIGEHDFKSFCMAVSAKDKPTCRNVHRIGFGEQVVMGEPVLVTTIAGNAFLHSMVRTIMGTLVMVGRGKRSPEWVEKVLLACDRTSAGENAPAQGLVLWDVQY